MTSLALVTAPTIEPVTLAEAKLHLRVDHGDEDALIESLVTSARTHVEHVTSRAFINQTWRLSLDAFPAEIRLPRPPLSSVTSLQYLDGNGTLQTLSASSYTVDSDAEPGRVVEAYATTWPSVRNDIRAVRVTYVAGYGATAATVPQPIKQAILLLVGHWYANREAVGTVGSDIAFAVDALLAPFRNHYPIDQ
jgi:uncharacterized phiE125 gp8 family phage protein